MKKRLVLPDRESSKCLARERGMMKGCEFMLARIETTRQGTTALLRRGTPARVRAVGWSRMTMTAGKDLCAYCGIRQRNE
jgi:hypothetical protein